MSSPYYVRDFTMPDEVTYQLIENYESEDVEMGVKPITDDFDELIIESHRAWAVDGKEFYGQLDTTAPWPCIEMMEENNAIATFDDIIDGMMGCSL